MKTNRELETIPDFFLNWLKFKSYGCMKGSYWHKGMMLVVLWLIFPLPSTAQKNFTLDEIWSGAFRTERLYDYHLVNDHALLRSEFTNGRYEINLYDLPSGRKLKTLFSTDRHNEFRYVRDYVYSPDLRYFLLSADVRPQYRHSFSATYYLYDTQSGELTPFEKDYIQIPSFSPDGSRVVYFKDNNLFLKELSTGETRPVTRDGEKNKIINGKTDWVYEEEFGFVQAYAFSGDGRYLAYLKFDESGVHDYTLTFYEGQLYPRSYTYKYPKAGTVNSTVRLWIYDTQTDTHREVPLPYDEYIPYLKPGFSDDEFLVMIFNRLQNDLWLHAVRQNRRDIRANRPANIPQIRGF